MNKGIEGSCCSKFYYSFYCNGIVVTNKNNCSLSYRGESLRCSVTRLSLSLEIAIFLSVLLNPWKFETIVGRRNKILKNWAS